MKTTIEGYAIETFPGRVVADDGKGHRLVIDGAEHTPEDRLVVYALDEIRATRERRAAMTEKQLKDEFDRLAARKGV
jgi:hypothetical protein